MLQLPNSRLTIAVYLLFARRKVYATLFRLPLLLTLNIELSRLKSRCSQMSLLFAMVLLAYTWKKLVPLPKEPSTAHFGMRKHDDAASRQNIPRKLLTREIDQ